jgi:hypothetical protein
MLAALLRTIRGENKIVCMESQAIKKGRSIRFVQALGYLQAKYGVKATA